MGKIEEISVKLHNERKESIIDLWQFVPEELKESDFSELVDSDWFDFVEELKNKKEAYGKENECLQKERQLELKRKEDERKRLEKERNNLIEKNRLNAIQFLFDHGFENTHGGMELVKYNWFIGANHYSELESEKEFDSFCLEITNDIKASAAQAEKEEALEKLRQKEEAERKAKEAEEVKLQAELNKGDAEKVKDLISDLENLKSKYQFKSLKNKQMYSDFAILVDKLINHINK